MPETLSQPEALGGNFANIDLSITPLIQFEGEELELLQNQNLFRKEPQTVDYLIDNSGARHLNMNAGIFHQHRIKTRKCD